MKYIEDLDEVVSLLILLGNFTQLLGIWDRRSNNFKEYEALLTSFGYSIYSPEEDYIFWMAKNMIYPIEPCEKRQYERSITNIKEVGYVTK